VYRSNAQLKKDTEVKGNRKIGSLLDFLWSNYTSRRWFCQ